MSKDSQITVMTSKVVEALKVAVHPEKGLPLLVLALMGAHCLDICLRPVHPLMNPAYLGWLHPLLTAFLAVMSTLLCLRLLFDDASTALNRVFASLFLIIGIAHGIDASMIHVEEGGRLDLSYFRWAGRLSQGRALPWFPILTSIFAMVWVGWLLSLRPKKDALSTQSGLGRSCGMMLALLVLSLMSWLVYRGSWLLA